MTEEPVPSPVADNLKRFHRVISRALDVSLDRAWAYSKETPQDPVLPRGLSDYVGTLELVLHEHHGSEDAMVFPSLRTWIPDAPYDQLSAEHRSMVAYLDQLDDALSRYSSHPAVSGAHPLADMADALSPLRTLWGRHIGLEESSLGPAVLNASISLDEQRHLLAQWDEGRRRNPAGPIERVLPFVLYTLAPEDRAVMAANMPPEVMAELVPRTWAAQWAPMKPFLLPDADEQARDSERAAA